MTNDHDHITFLQERLINVQAERDREHSMRVAAEHRLHAAIGERDEALERLYKATRLRDPVLLRPIAPTTWSHTGKCLPGCTCVASAPTSRPPESIL